MPRINPEDGMGFGPEEQDELVEKLSSDSPLPAPRPAGAMVRGPNDVDSLIKQALAGTMETDRPLKEQEPIKFSPLHVNLVIDRAGGLKPAELIQKYDVGPALVSRILGHPYAQRILAAMISNAADAVADPLARLQGYAHEMINIKMELARDKATPRVLRNSIASDILDRAGLGARQAASNLGPNAQSPGVPVEVVSRLTEALVESSRSRGQHDYRRFLAASRGEGGDGEVFPGPSESSLPAGGPSSAGAPPSGPLPLGQVEAA